jgi:hypothetical protein
MTLGEALEAGTFFTAVVGLGALFVQVRVDHNRSRRQATLDWASEAFHRQWIENELPDFSDVVQFREFAAEPLRQDHSPNRSIAIWLDMMEDLAVGVRLHVYELEVVEGLLRTRILRGWRNLRPWIEAHREARDQRSLYSEFEHLAREIWSRWRNDMPEDVRDAPEFGP